MTNTNNKKNVTAGKPKTGGSIYRAAAGTTLPKDAMTELDQAFKSLGYISDDGVVFSNEKETESVKAWGGDTVLNAQTGYTEKAKFTLLEALNEEVQKTARGDSNVSGTLAAGMTVKTNAKEDVPHAYVIEQVLGEDVLFRTVIPEGKVLEVGDVSYVDGEPVGYEITVGLEPDTDGQYHYEYYKKGGIGG